MSHSWLTYGLSQRRLQTLPGQFEGNSSRLENVCIGASIGTIKGAWSSLGNCSWCDTLVFDNHLAELRAACCRLTGLRSAQGAEGVPDAARDRLGAAAGRQTGQAAVRRAGGPAQQEEGGGRPEDGGHSRLPVEAGVRAGRRTERPSRPRVSQAPDRDSCGGEAPALGGEWTLRLSVCPCVCVCVCCVVRGVVLLWLRLIREASVFPHHSPAFLCRGRAETVILPLSGVSNTDRGTDTDTWCHSVRALRGRTMKNIAVTLHIYREPLGIWHFVTNHTFGVFVARFKGVCHGRRVPDFPHVYWPPARVCEAMCGGEVPLCYYHTARSQRTTPSHWHTDADTVRLPGELSNNLWLAYRFASEGVLVREGRASVCGWRGVEWMGCPELSGWGSFTLVWRLWRAGWVRSAQPTDTGDADRPTWNVCCSF